MNDSKKQNKIQISVKIPQFLLFLRLDMVANDEVNPLNIPEASDPIGGIV